MNGKLVISAIALRSGGTLSILQDCLAELCRPAYSEMTIVVFVQHRAVAGALPENVSVVEIDGARSYLHRIYYEYFYFRKISRRLNPDIWLSLHDISPVVYARRQAVYCHNPSAFYSVSLREFILDPKFALFTWLYEALYRINIRSNTFVVVQQQWLREQFATRFGLRSESIIVAHPRPKDGPIPAQQTKSSGPFTFFYPAFPRIFKNIEILGEAAQILAAKNLPEFKVIVTVNGHENAYAGMLRRKFAHLTCFELLGWQTRAAVFKLYQETDCLVFPSKLETWGLPITEFAHTGRPMLLADLPYGRETAGDYPRAAFFDPGSPADLAAKMEAAITDSLVFPRPAPPAIPAPMASNWTELFRLLLNGD